MLTTLFTAVELIWGGLQKYGRQILKWGVVSSALSGFWAFLTQISNGLDAIHSQLLAVQTMTHSGDWSVYYGRINAVVPLSEVMVMIATAFGWACVCVAIRFAVTFAKWAIGALAAA